MNDLSDWLLWALRAFAWLAAFGFFMHLYRAVVEKAKQTALENEKLKLEIQSLRNSPEVDPDL